MFKNLISGYKEDYKKEVNLFKDADLTLSIIFDPTNLENPPKN